MKEMQVEMESSFALFMSYLRLAISNERHNSSKYLFKTTNTSTQFLEVQTISLDQMCTRKYKLGNILRL